MAVVPEISLFVVWRAFIRDEFGLLSEREQEAILITEMILFLPPGFTCEASEYFFVYPFSYLEEENARVWVIIEKFSDGLGIVFVLIHHEGLSSVQFIELVFKKSNAEIN